MFSFCKLCKFVNQLPTLSLPCLKDKSKFTLVFWICQRQLKFRMYKECPSTATPCVDNKGVGDILVPLPIEIHLKPMPHIPDDDPQAYRLTLKEEILLIRLVSWVEEPLGVAWRWARGVRVVGYNFEARRIYRQPHCRSRGWQTEIHMRLINVKGYFRLIIWVPNRIEHW